MTHLFQRTKITAATIPIIDRQNGNTIDTASTVLRFSTLFARGLALPATDPLDTGAVIAVCLEVFSVGVTVVKLFGLFVFWVDCSKVDVVFCKLGLVYVVPLFSRVGVDEVDKASFSKGRKKRVITSSWLIDPFFKACICTFSSETAFWWHFRILPELAQIRTTDLCYIYLFQQR